MDGNRAEINGWSAEGEGVSKNFGPTTHSRVSMRSVPMDWCEAPRSSSS